MPVPGKSARPYDLKKAKRFLTACPLTDEWVKKLWCICTLRYHSVIKKNEIVFVCRKMDGTRNNHVK
jgi:hypothetical protein